jgi:hypothetical protein
MDAYNDIYADSRKWLREGWVDAVVPQLYWAIEPPDQSFPSLLNWWDSQNLRARHLWPGLLLTRQGDDKPDWLSREIPQQISLVQNHTNANGFVMFSGRMLREYPDFHANLSGNLLATPAVVPDAPWLRLRTPLLRGEMQSDRNGSTLLLTAPEDPIRWVIHRRGVEGWRTSVLPGTVRQIPMESADTAVMVQGVHRAGQRSIRVGFERRN